MSESAQAVEASTVHIRTTEVEDICEEVAVSLEHNSIDYLAERKKPLRARYIYGVIFLIMNLCAWFVRDYGQLVLPQLHYLKSCGNGGGDCFRTLGVLRVSLGCLIYFFLMFLTTFKTRKLHEGGNSWHSGWWGLKSLLLIISMVLPIFFPAGFIQIYGEVARVGAGIFLVLQLISVIQFINWWNKYWMPDDQEKKQSCSFGLFMSTLFYIGSIGGIVYMYITYAIKSSCMLNIFFITWTTILLLVMMAISLHSKVNRGLLSSGIMASYVVYLCWSALRSEPANDRCNKHKLDNGNDDWTTILGFLIAIGAIVMATFSTGIDSQSFQFRKDEVQEENDIPYNYGFFHLVFSFGAMYFAMLFISWNLNNSARKWSIDIGWTSTWVKIVNEWFAASIYLWTLISPIVRQPKVMHHEDPVQDTNDSVLA
ncbi:uncharacterized protein LOC107422600 [Ziziphus jujuba]|uniref:Uncharacterized protein LOC107422600 n=3 Tax=Ziziphus jujuba TaxID=326968 RepID=A0A6P6GCE8_ZIZJJ|nr:uncharacterized protein LOC107422600 [Ziziphus jujuba]XP_024931766.3 uncharacterized protein LOC107422600 [Ziziphus jujuba]XP_060671889.1 uncharacterized protein LOC107422600 [Ziziphus jujuba]